MRRQKGVPETPETPETSRTDDSSACARRFSYFATHRS
jgi:hypothetical protein